MFFVALIPETEGGKIHLYLIITWIPFASSSSIKTGSRILTEHDKTSGKLGVFANVF